MEFVAIDIETANSNISSICQVGLVRVENFEIVEEWSSLINPLDSFDAINTSIHGITENCVVDAPEFSHVHNELHRFINGKVCVSHGSFDKSALEQATSRHRTQIINCQWLDTIKVVRRLWPRFKDRGYGLADVCSAIGYDFQHHDALEDARAAAVIMMIAIEQSRRDIGFWLERIQKPIKLPPKSQRFEATVKRQGKGNGNFAGETIVFTGTLQIGRSEAADRAAQLGFDVDANVTKRTTTLVVGTQDLSILAGHSKSSKHRKAEQLLQKGHNIKILSEDEFFKLQ